MQTFLILEIIAFVLILFGVNIYLLFLYIHHDDKRLCASPYAKIFIVLGLTVCQAQALLVPLDVTNNSALLSPSDRQLDMGLLWLIIYCTLLAFICILIPFAIFFY